MVPRIALQRPKVPERQVKGQTSEVKGKVEGPANPQGWITRKSPGTRVMRIPGLPFHVVYRYFASSLTAVISIWTFARSDELFASASSDVASVVSAVRRAPPRPSRRRQSPTDRRDPRSGQALRPLELIDERARLREARRPHEAALFLRVPVVQLDGLGGVDLVLRDERARHELEDVEAAADFRADDDAVVPVGRPRAAADQPRRRRAGRDRGTRLRTASPDRSSRRP